MKIIDLLNKIAKGEAPKKIKCDGVIYNYEFQNTIIGSYEYISQNGTFLMNNMTDHLYLTDILTNEVEIIEEEKDIEELNITERRKREDCYPLTVEIMAKINENQLKNHIKKPQ